MIIYLSLGAIFATGVLWIIWMLQPEKVVLEDNEIIKKYKGRSQRFNLSGLNQINYHYSAIAGVISVWEFIDVEGHTVKISGDASGINSVIASLEAILPKFSLANFKNQLKAGEIEDTITVWQKA